MKKKGQFYLLAAIVIISVLIGFATISNYSKKNSAIKIYDLGDELGIEGGEVLDFGTYSSYSEPQTTDLLESFTIMYTEFAGEGKEMYFVFGDIDTLSIATYSEIITGSISVNIGESTTNILMDQKGYSITKNINPTATEKVIVNIKDIPYTFDLQQGQNFYFIISQEVGG